MTIIRLGGCFNATSRQKRPTNSNRLCTRAKSLERTSRSVAAVICTSRTFRAPGHIGSMLRRPPFSRGLRRLSAEPSAGEGSAKQGEEASDAAGGKKTSKSGSKQKEEGAKEGGGQPDVDAVSLQHSFSLMKWLFCLVAALLLINPAYAVEKYFEAPATAMNIYGARLLAALLLPVSMATTCLQDAAAKARLSSRTYKRLNLSLLLFAVALLALDFTKFALISFGVDGITNAHSPHRVFAPVAMLTPAFAYISAFNTISVDSVIQGARTVLEDASSSCQASLYSMLVLLHASWGAALIIAPSLATKLIFHPQGSPDIWRVVGIAHIPVVIVLYTLLDAARRSRITASTFRKLNLSLAAFATTALLIHAHCFYFDTISVPLVYSTAVMLLSFIPTLGISLHFYFQKKE
ncbi:hypothetical protein CYMTET_43665 [Cymbomonas tetramitiformis]|uniref:Uncharacterized protein n=1 Tax=Cymbomonas tetramitiformis TaxID=36881 RepID=A0AAE0C1Q8_9CHLO|nr:hypothetical protein CYMTET_43665 [Cymbomonas tetramitiformis]